MQLLKASEFGGYQFGLIECLKVEREWYKQNTNFRRILVWAVKLSLLRKLTIVAALTHLTGPTI